MFLTNIIIFGKYGLLIMVYKLLSNNNLYNVNIPV